MVIARCQVDYAGRLTAHLPMATVTALGFSMPIFLSIVSVPLLGERVGALRAGAVAAGLLGVLVVLRPWRAEGAVELGPALVVVAGVVAWAPTRWRRPPRSSRTSSSTSPRSPAPAWSPSVNASPD